MAESVKGLPPISAVGFGPKLLVAEQAVIAKEHVDA
jgi:hypothetical protein